MRKQSFQQVALFAVSRTAVTMAFAIFFAGIIALIAFAGAKSAEACSMYDPYGCGSYAYSNYGDYYNYWPYYSTAVSCNTCGGYGYDNYSYGYNDYNYGGYGYNMPIYGGYNNGYNYYPYPSYEYIPNPQTSRGNRGGSSLSNYNYVQYPYYEYTYFQNPAPQNSQNGLGAYNYVQYPYPTYVYNR